MASENAKSKFVRECIVMSLIELMKTESYNSISITDITSKAGVSRMAYYRNYSSKDDILNTYMDGVGKEIHDKLIEHTLKKDYYLYFLDLFDYLGRHSDVGVVTIKANLGDMIQKHINKYMLLTFAPKDDSPAARYRCLFVAGAFYNVFSEWIQSGKRESCEELARVCSSMISK